MQTRAALRRVKHSDVRWRGDSLNGERSEIEVRERSIHSNGIPLNGDKSDKMLPASDNPFSCNFAKDEMSRIGNSLKDAALAELAETEARPSTICCRQQHRIRTIFDRGRKVD